MNLIKNKHFRKFAALAIVDGAMFGLTNPRSVPPIGLMAGFLLLVVTLYYLFSGLVRLTRLYGVRLKRPRRLALIATGLIAGLVALQSIGELNALDIMVLVPLVVVGYVYGYYGRGDPSRYQPL